MLLSLALIFLSGLGAAAVCHALRLPRIIGMLLIGIALGPYALNLLDPSVLSISSELRQIALIIILIKAGLSLDISDLKRVGRPAILMSFLPACFEIIAFVIFAPTILTVSILDAAIIGAVLGAVSPAVVVPRMVALMEQRLGTDKSVPQLILAGASLDDVFVIVLFSAFIGMAQGEGVHVGDFIGIPISIILGIALGSAVGLTLAGIFEMAHNRSASIRNSAKVVILLGVSFLMMSIEDALEGVLPISGLLAIMAASAALKIKCRKEVAFDLSQKFGKLWVAAEVVLFVLVGAAVDVRYTLQAGLAAVVMILIALIFRSFGVLICLIKTPLSIKEKLFCVIAYIPKATVQAAIGSVPLTLGLGCGNIVLSVAVLSIIITAPLGAIGIDSSAKRLLNSESNNITTG